MMTDKNVNSQKNKNVKNFSYSKFKENWPFCVTLATDLFTLNSTGHFFSFKDFLIYTWSEEKKLCQEDSFSESEDEQEDYSNHSNNYNKPCWEILKYSGFFIENDVVYFKELINKKGKSFDIFTDQDSKVCIYSLEDLSYQSLILEATKFYINSFFQRKIVGVERSEKGEETLKFLSIHKIWSHIFGYLLFTPYSSSIKNLLEVENYKSKYKKQLIHAFYSESSYLDSYESRLEAFLLPLTQETEESLIAEKTLILKERFENLFSLSDISTKDGEKLVNNFFLTKTFQEIALFYKIKTYDDFFC